MEVLIYRKGQRYGGARITVDSLDVITSATKSYQFAVGRFWTQDILKRILYLGTHDYVEEN